MGGYVQTLREWMQRLAGAVLRRRRDDDLERELRSHLELAAEDDHRPGTRSIPSMRPPASGSVHVSQAMDLMRDQRGWPWLEDFVRDVRHGLRGFGRAPGFTIVSLLTLVLGIGANTGVFSIVRGVILRPLAYPRPDRLMKLGSSSGGGLSYPEYAEFQAMTRSFSAVGVYTTGRGNVGGGAGAWFGEVNITAGDRPLCVRSAGVDERALEALGVKPAYGRFFGGGETDAMAARPGLGGPPVAILSHELWRTAFAGEPAVGRSIQVDGRPHEVIGIMPPGVDLADSQPEIWLPIGVHPVTRGLRTAHVLNVVGRLRDGVTHEAAQAELDAFLQNWADRAGATGHVPTGRPSRADDHALVLQPLQETIVADASRAIWLLQGAVVLVLVIGCANLASLALARGESRRRELAVRAAIGAGRGRLIRQAMTEGLLLSTTGGALGVWLAHIGLRALLAAFPASLPRAGDIAIDVPVLSFALGVSTLTGLLLGVVPLMRRRTGTLMSVMRNGDRGVSGGRQTVRRVLVLTEVALAVMLVMSAALLLQTVGNLRQIDAGFNRSRLVTFSMTLPRATEYAGGRAPVYQHLLESIRSSPGIHRATAMSGLPLSRPVQRFSTRVEHGPAPADQVTEFADFYQFVMSDYFETMEIPIVAGRAFGAADAASQDRVAIVSESAARKFWTGRSPIGLRIRPNLSGSLGVSGNPWHTVIGVAKDVKEAGVDRASEAEVYLFIDQPAPSMESAGSAWAPAAPPTLNVVLRSSLSPAQLSVALEKAVREVDPAVPIVRLREMEAVFAQSIERQTLLAQLLSAFAGFALLLAVVGTYGVLSYMVTAARREIGVRMALGAARSTVMALVLKQGLTPALAGVAAGVAGALALNRLFASLLFGVHPTDSMTLATVALTITVAALLACCIPAWRASRLDPNRVLRTD